MTQVAVGWTISVSVTWYVYQPSAISKITGSLEVGKAADIIAVPGNPLDEIRQTEKVFFVMRDGTIYKNSRP